MEITEAKPTGVWKRKQSSTSMNTLHSNGLNENLDSYDGGRPHK